MLPGCCWCGGCPGVLLPLCFFGRCPAAEDPWFQGWWRFSGGVACIRASQTLVLPHTPIPVSVHASVISRVCPALLVVLWGSCTVWCLGTVAMKPHQVLCQRQRMVCYGPRQAVYVVGWLQAQAGCRGDALAPPVAARQYGRVGFSPRTPHAVMRQQQQAVGNAGFALCDRQAGQCLGWGGGGLVCVSLPRPAAGD